ncbi:hypothetical protein MJO28_004303 [Puccinia striiformis f. sp. tritici]|uniref:Uncharacterized protein n=1 Tax=Puccinia striiformis f. sp. tritici TaxID=168172 RepID=A0ACC0EQ95_9BASI|nr:hypothetical protein MJO28_004303 [Puccinia striiformis f. sp. tritici]
MPEYTTAERPVYDPGRLPNSDARCSGAIRGFGFEFGNPVLNARAPGDSKIAPRSPARTSLIKNG